MPILNHTLEESVRVRTQELEQKNRQLVSDRITLIMGVSALLPTAELIAQTLLSATDIALYEAKNSGRARIVVHHAVHPL